MALPGDRDEQDELLVRRQLWIFASSRYGRSSRSSVRACARAKKCRGNQEFVLFVPNALSRRVVRIGVERPAGVRVVVVLDQLRVQCARADVSKDGAATLILPRGAASWRDRSVNG